MRADPRSRQRKTIRLPGRDYRADGLYYVTIVCEGRRPVLSEVREGHIALSPIGEIVTECWLAVPNLRTCHTCERRYRTHPIVYPGQPGAVAKIATQHMKSVGAKHPPLARGTLERNGGCFARAHATPRATRYAGQATRHAVPRHDTTRHAPRDTRRHATPRHDTRHAPAPAPATRGAPAPAPPRVRAKHPQLRLGVRRPCGGCFAPTLVSSHRL